MIIFSYSLINHAIIKIVILSAPALGVAILAMAVFLFFKRKELQETKIGHNKKMRKKRD